MERWGLGPVFVYESLLNARRWQVYAARSMFVLALLIGMGIVWIGNINQATSFNTTAPLTFQAMSRIGEKFFYALAGIQLALVLLAAPAATAGSICMDRARGTLLHMMVTDLSDVEIVLGKLAARVAPVLGLVCCALPVAALAALLGGIDFGALAGLFAVSLALTVFGCALALTVSVWASKTHEALMAVYTLEGFWLLSLPMWHGFSMNLGIWGPPDWYQKGNPIVLTFSPFESPGFVDAIDYLVFVIFLLTLAFALLVLSIVKLRRVTLERTGRRKVRLRNPLSSLTRLIPALPGPRLDANPVLWREWHRNRPTRLTRLLWSILLFGTWALAVGGVFEIVMWKPQRPMLLPSALALQLMFGLLMLSVTAPTVLAEERVRGSLDVLLTTPLSSRSIVLAKWWGAYRLVLLLLPVPLLTGVLFGMTMPDSPAYASIPSFPITIWDRWLFATLLPADFLASGAVITSLGIALAVWVRRLGRAVMLSVVAYIAGVIGLAILTESVILPLLYSRFAFWYTRNDWIRHALMAINPLVGPLQAFDYFIFVFKDRSPMWISHVTAVLAKAILALVVLRVTIHTFDRCMSRMPESTQLTPSQKKVSDKTTLEAIIT